MSRLTTSPTACSARRISRLRPFADRQRQPGVRPLLLTNDGALKRRLELPSTGWQRKYRVRVHGTPDAAMLAPLGRGITVEGERFQPMRVEIDRQQGSNAWLTWRSARDEPRGAAGAAGGRAGGEPADPGRLRAVPARRPRAGSGGGGAAEGAARAARARAAEADATGTGTGAAAAVGVAVPAAGRGGRHPWPSAPTAINRPASGWRRSRPGSARAPPAGSGRC